MRVQNRWLFWLLLACLVLRDCVRAQDASSPTAYELQPIFSDDFSKDTRGGYAITGDASWEAGRLTLQPDASVGRAIKGGAWVKVDVSQEISELTVAQPDSELQIWMKLDGATDCFVQIHRTQTDQGQTMTAALFDTSEQAGKPVKVLVGESILDAADVGQLTVEYRYGLVRVTADDVNVLTGYIQNGSVSAAGFRITGPRTSLNLNRISASSIPVPNELTAEQQEQLTKAAAANTRLVELYGIGKYPEAASIGEEVLRIRDTVLGPDHPDTAASLNNLAEMYRSQANYSAAGPLFERALKISEKVLGPVHPDTASSLNNLAMLYESQGNYSAAEPFYMRALEIHETALGHDHPATGGSLNNLATLYLAQANWDAAEPLLLRALKISEKADGPHHPSTGNALNSLAFLYKSQGNFAAAEPLYVRALSINEKALGPEHQITARSLNNLAGVYQSQANYEAAEPLLQRALRIVEAVHGPDHPESAPILNNLAKLYKNNGNAAAALPLYLRALKIREKTFGQDHPDTAQSLNNLAALHDSQGNHISAVPLYEQALKIRERALGPDHPATAASLNNLAMLYDRQKNYTAAEPLYQRALKIRETVLGLDHPDTAISLNCLAVLKWDSNQPVAATLLAEQALGIRLRHLDGTAAIQTEQQQFLMARDVVLDVGTWLTVTGADPQSTPAVYRDVLVWKGLITARQQGLRLALKNDPQFADFRRVTQQLSTVSLNPPQPPSNPEALAAWKIREPELRQAWEDQKMTLQADHERLEKELAVKSVAFRESLEQRRVQPDDLVATLKAQDRPTALVDVLEYGYYGRKSRNEKRERRIVAFVVRGDLPVVRVELGSAEEIASQVALWRESFGRKVADKDPGAELRRLVWLPLEAHLQGIETVLISPDGALAQLPWGALPGEQAGSYLLEDRALAVIPVPQMLPSLLGKAHRQGPPESLLLAGDIEYGGDPGQPQDLLAKRDAVGRLSDGRFTQFQRLPAANAELASIERRYRKQVQIGKSSTLESGDATEAAFREQASQHQWLHVITHGFFAPETVHSALQSTNDDVENGRPSEQPRQVRGENPGLLSGLAFAGASTPPEPDKDDGILTALEVAALDLNEVDAVVLSACETGLGEVAGGEGLLGLQRAFQVAGAKTVVASLWKVPDAATARLMQRFYENLWDRKLGKLEALREAQLWMMKDQSARGAEVIQDAADNSRLPPEYWAAFVLSGDWR